MNWLCCTPQGVDAAEPPYDRMLLLYPSKTTEGKIYRAEPGVSREAQSTDRSTPSLVRGEKRAEICSRLRSLFRLIQYSTSYRIVQYSTLSTMKNRNTDGILFFKGVGK